MRRLGANEHIVQARRSAVTPAKARPEKYHGVVRELPKVDLDRTSGSSGSSFNASTLLFEPPPPVSYITRVEQCIKDNLRTVVAVFGFLLIICVAAQMGRFEETSSPEPHFEKIVEKAIVPDFSPMQEQLRELKLLVAQLNEKQEASDELIAAHQLRNQQLLEKIAAQATTPAPATVAPPQVESEPCDFKESEERILASLEDQLNEFQKNQQVIQDDFEGKYDIFLQQIAEVSKALREIPPAAVASSSTANPPDSPRPETIPDIAQMLDEKLWKFDADRTGLADFALESAGAEIIPELTSQGLKNNSPILSIWKFPVFYQTMSPRIAITPGAYPGTCFAFAGGSGTLAIKLSQPVVVQNITVQHIPKETSPVGHINSAPRTFELFSVDGRNEQPLGEFVFDAEGKPIQTFQVKSNSLVSAAVKFKFNSNWGAEHTCVYRTRVHGSLSHNVV